MKNLNEENKNNNRTIELIVEGRKYIWYDQYISGMQIKKLAGLPSETEIYLDIDEPWKDDEIKDDEIVDLGRAGIEQFFVKQKLRYTINGIDFDSDKQFLKGKQIRKQGNIPSDYEIYMSIKGPWEDDLIEDEEIIDLARPGIEHFYSKPAQNTFVLMVNGRIKEWLKKKITFEEVVMLAFGNYDENPNTIYTVTFAKGPLKNPEGSMVRKDSVFVIDKMVFNVSATNKS